MEALPDKIAEAIRDEARATLEEALDRNDVTVYDDARIEEGGDGYWVEARVWVPKP